jgi:hypothetical protein
MKTTKRKSKRVKSKAESDAPFDFKSHTNTYSRWFESLCDSYDNETIQGKIEIIKSKLLEFDKILISCCQTPEFDKLPTYFDFSELENPVKKLVDEIRQIDNDRLESKAKTIENLFDQIIVICKSRISSYDMIHKLRKLVSNINQSLADTQGYLDGDFEEIQWDKDPNCMTAEDARAKIKQDFHIELSLPWFTKHTKNRDIRSKRKGQRLIVLWPSVKDYIQKSDTIRKRIKKVAVQKAREDILSDILTSQNL